MSVLGNGTRDMAATAGIRRVSAGRVPHAALVNACPRCGQVHESRVFTVAKWRAWLRARANGASVQGFWPELPPAEREEFFISGVCGVCWKKMFPPEDQDGAGGADP